MDPDHLRMCHLYELIMCPFKVRMTSADNNLQLECRKVRMRALDTLGDCFGAPRRSTSTTIWKHSTYAFILNLVLKPRNRQLKEGHYHTSAHCEWAPTAENDALCSVLHTGPAQQGNTCWRCHAPPWMFVWPTEIETLCVSPAAVLAAERSSRRPWHCQAAQRGSARGRLKATNRLSCDIRSTGS